LGVLGEKDIHDALFELFARVYKVMLDAQLLSDGAHFERTTFVIGLLAILIRPEIQRHSNDLVALLLE
jgi:hypothetical protein